MIPLKPRQSQVLNFIVNNPKPYPVVFSDIAHALGIKYDTARKIVRKLDMLGFVDLLIEGGRCRAIVPLYKE